MPDRSISSLTPEHRDFYERFKSFWAAPSGARVTELIAPDATIHFTGAGTFSGAEYIDAMQGMLDSFVKLKVTPLDCAGNGERLYIFWETSAVINGGPRSWMGVDRFRLANGMAIEEHCGARQNESWFARQNKSSFVAGLSAEIGARFI